LEKSVFLVYLVLLLNFGPGFHRAHFFGLHSAGVQSDGCCHSHDDQSVFSGFHSHSGCDASRLHQHDQTTCSLAVSDECSAGSAGLAVEQSSDDGSLIVPEHDCSICKFFGDYHVTLVDFDFCVSESKFFFRHFDREFDVVAATIPVVARGPPAIS
jgi:hypothetical protein